MSSFEQNINELKQFIIAVKVFPPTESQGDYNKVEGKATNYRALVDTGANGSCISKQIVGDLELKPYSERSLMTAGGIHVSPIYLVGLAVSVRKTRMQSEQQEDGSTVARPAFVSEESKGVPKMKVTTFPDVGADRSFDMILGMDILINFHITICLGKIIISI